MMTSHTRIPGGIKALSIFFFVASGIAFTALVSLLFPGGYLDPIWQINPRGHDVFITLGNWSFLLLGVLYAACLSAGIGLWQGRRWGYILAASVLTVNLIGDLVNAILGTEPRALAGVPIVAAILVYLMTRRVRTVFR
jgi:hypothetical protein